MPSLYLPCGMLIPFEEQSAKLMYEKLFPLFEGMAYTLVHQPCLTKTRSRYHNHRGKKKPAVPVILGHESSHFSHIPIPEGGTQGLSRTFQGSTFYTLPHQNTEALLTGRLLVACLPRTLPPLAVPSSSTFSSRKLVFRGVERA